MGIAERVEEWTREWHEAGRQEGRQEGRERLQDVVLYLLEQRFGTFVSGPTRTRVFAIRDLDELTRLAKGALSARSLRDLGLED